MARQRYLGGDAVLCEHCRPVSNQLHPFSVRDTSMNKTSFQANALILNCMRHHQCVEVGNSDCPVQI